ncbi:MAG: redoxin domain-containing protein [Leptospira sp.]|nr:redoxin domain-containing protein [Leptospira sp.]NCS92794.1 redoxin domain-containing protein [Leptospira sp.]
MDAKDLRYHKKNTWIKYLMLFIGFTVISLGLAFFRGSDHGTTPKLNDSLWVQGSESIDLKPNQPTVFYFWATWCSVCKLNEPFLKFALSAIQDRAVNFVSIEEGSVSPSELKDFLKDKDIQFPVVVIPSNRIQEFNVTGYPTTIFVDKNHTIRFVDSGILSPISFWIRLYITKLYS